MPKLLSDDELRKQLENIVIVDDYVHGIQIKTLDSLWQLVKQYGIEQRLDEVEETKEAIMRGEHGHDEVSIVRSLEQSINQLTNERQG